MGGVKRLMEEQEGKQNVAIQIALEAGVLKSCEYHEDFIFDTGKDILNAYMLANAKYTEDHYIDVFNNRKEMTDFIKDVVEEHLPVECPFCAKL
ncbi:MAG: hypothetical protein IH874_06665 [Candidatus Dadabacteria bacterium]|nr:hypothetical protein [Candidatus Dadabacteria bacterium]